MLTNRDPPVDADRVDKITVDLRHRGLDDDRLERAIAAAPELEGERWYADLRQEHQATLPEIAEAAKQVFEERQKSRRQRQRQRQEARKVEAHRRQQGQQAGNDRLSGIAKTIGVSVFLTVLTAATGGGV